MSVEHSTCIKFCLIKYQSIKSLLCGFSNTFLDLNPLEYVVDHGYFFLMLLIHNQELLDKVLDFPNH